MQRWMAILLHCNSNHPVEDATRTHSGYIAEIRSGKAVSNVCPSGTNERWSCINAHT